MAAVLSLGVALSSLGMVALTATQGRSTPTSADPAAGHGQPGVNEAGLPLGFEPNVGQTGPNVQFLAHGQGSTTWLSPADARVSSHGAMVDMRLVSADPHADVSPEDGLPGVVNYLIGPASQWHTNIPTYARVVYRDVWPGIDVAYHGTQSGLEYDFTVAPGADPARIVLLMEGVSRTGVDTLNGDLVMKTTSGTVVRHRAPHLYQVGPSGRQPISGRFAVRGNTVRFAVGGYDHGRPLVIDPTVSNPRLAYSTYLGGGPGPSAFSGTDGATAVTVDSSGNVYVTGTSDSPNFPTTPGAFSTTNGHNAVFVTKIATLNSGVQSLVYSTFLGSNDTASGIAVDSAGEAYVAGTAGNFGSVPTTKRALQPKKPGFQSGFVTKLNATGSGLLYSTYLGGSGNTIQCCGDGVSAIALDSKGNAYVTGLTQSTDFPVTGGAFQTTCPNAASGTGCITGFVAKISNNGSKLAYSTFLGAEDTNPNDFYGAGQGLGVAVDSAGSAYVTGFFSVGAATPQPLFPTTPGAFQTAGCAEQLTAFYQCYGAFVTKLNAGGSALVYSSVLAGNNFEAGYSIAVDAGGNAYVEGATGSTDFPTTSGAYQTSPGPSFVTKLNANGTGLAYSTYFPGVVPFTAFATLAIDHAGDVYITGVTGGSTTFPTTAGSFQTTAPGGGKNNDAFVSKLNATGTGLAYSTYLGGATNDDIGQAIAVDGGGNAYVVGQTFSTDFPTTSSAAQTSAGGNGDGFMSKLNATGAAPAYSTYLDGSALNPTPFSGFDTGNGVAVDSMGEAYIAGCTESGTFPTTSGAFQTSNSNPYAAFVSKFNVAGSALLYSTYLGPIATPQCGLGGGIRALAGVDAAGDAVVAGVSGSASFPTTSGAYDTTTGDDFVTELNGTGSALIYSSRLPGDITSAVLGPSVNAGGSPTVYVTGNAGSTFPTTPGAYQSPCGGGGFVLRLNPASNGAADLLYSTCGVGGFRIAVDATGAAYVAPGAATSTPGAFQTAGTGQTSIAKLDPTGGGASDLMYSTFFPGAGVLGLAVGPPVPGGSMPTVYLTGATQATDLPLTPGAFQTTNNGLFTCGNPGCGNAFVARINPAGGSTSDLLYSTYIGGGTWDFATGIAVDSHGRAVITGNTISLGYPTTNNAIQRRCGCNAFNLRTFDAFVSVLDPALAGASQLVFSTYFGGAGAKGSSITLDVQGNGYLTGVTGASPQDDPHTHVPGFPITRGAFQPNPGGGGDAFLAKITSL